MAIKIEQYQKTADGSYQLMYPKTQADCVLVSSGGNLQTKLSDIDKKVTYELTCNKTGNTYALSGIPSVEGLVSCFFEADEDFASGDGFTVGGTAYSVQTLDGNTLTTGAFKAGAVVPVIIDTEGQKINFKMGGSRQAGTRLVTEIFVGDPSGTESTQTWTCPEGVTQARVRLFGAGGNGGGRNSGGYFFPRGGGGGHMVAENLSVTPGHSYSITFEPRSTTDPNGTGSPTKFENLLTASGGTGGTGNRTDSGCGGTGGGGAGIAVTSGTSTNYITSGGNGSYGGGGGSGTYYDGDDYNFTMHPGSGGKYGGGGGAGYNDYGGSSQYNQYIDGISFIGETINGSVNDQTADPGKTEQNPSFRKGLGGVGDGYALRATDISPNDVRRGVNTTVNNYGITPLDFKGQGNPGQTTQVSRSPYEGMVGTGHGFGGGGGFGGNGGDGGEYGGGGGGGYGGNGGNGGQYAGGGGGGYGADGGNASEYCGGGGGGYGPLGKGGDGETVTQVYDTYVTNNCDGGLAAGGGGQRYGEGGKGGPGVCIIQYYL